MGRPIYCPSCGRSLPGGGARAPRGDRGRIRLLPPLPVAGGRRAGRRVGGGLGAA
jgi:hypothetical protein